MKKKYFLFLLLSSIVFSILFTPPVSARSNAHIEEHVQGKITFFIFNGEFAATDSQAQQMWDASNDAMRQFIIGKAKSITNSYITIYAPGRKFGQHQYVGEEAKISY